MSKEPQTPRAAPVSVAALPRRPHQVGRFSGNPPRAGQPPHAVLNERPELAAHPAAEGQRESLLGMRDDGVGQRTFEGAGKQALPGHQVRVPRQLGPHALDQILIDERHADFEAMGHRHDVEVAQQLRAQIQTALEPGHGGLRRFGCCR